MENAIISESGNGACHYTTPEEQGNISEGQGSISEEQEMLPPELSLQDVSDIVDQGMLFIRGLLWNNDDLLAFRQLRNT